MFLSESLNSELLHLKVQYSPISLRSLFEQDETRAARFFFEASSLSIDFSKSFITDDLLRSLLKIASERNLSQHIESMFSGDKINRTENRAVLHTALRAPSDSEVVVEGMNVMPEIQHVLANMQKISTELISGTWFGSTGKPIDTVVNIGIGGSDLGPAMAVQALTPFQASNIQQYFISNVDPAEISFVLKQCNPETTLFIIASKTFTTTETLLNASIAKQWLQDNLTHVEDLTQHFIALSTNVEEAVKFGVSAENVLGFWEWVGGRFSLPSAIGLSLMIRVGSERFSEFLAGMHAMDVYFQRTPFEQNAIVIYALMGIWYRNFLQYSSYAILPYDSLLSRLPAYLQQLIMESNGKRVDVQGKEIDYNTSFVIWGEPGTNGQHSFHQLLHQGTEVIPVDFLFAATSTTENQASHDVLVANAVAQAMVLAFGSEGDEPVHKHMPGNRPSITFVYEELNPYVLGQIIAFYEHVVFTQGILWNINSFDQWGVELGKKVAVAILPALQNVSPPVTYEKAIIEKIQSLRKGK